MGADCEGVLLCDGGPCSLGFFRLGSSGPSSLSSDIKFDFLGSAALGAEGAGTVCIGAWLSWE